MWAQQTLLSPTNGDGKRESVEDRSNELEACQSVCVSVSWRSLSFNFVVKINHYRSLEVQIRILRDYSVAVHHLSPPSWGPGFDSP